MKIIWEVDDGYVSGARPQETIIPDEDFEGMDEEEKERYIEQCIEEDFREVATWYETGREK